MTVTLAVTLSRCCREKRQSSSPEIWPPNSPDLNPLNYSVWYSSREGLPFADPWCERVKNLCWVSEGCWCWTIYIYIIAAVIAQWRRLSAEHKCYRAVTYFLVCLICLLTLVTVNLCDITTCKRQSANAWNACVTFVSEIFTLYGSNKTNVWQEILTPSIYFGILLQSRAQKIMKIRV